MDRIYLDNAATTAVSQPVMEAMLPYYMQVYGNPSSIHSTGRDAKKAVERARRQVAAALGCSAQEIYFTAGGSESDNWALKGAAFAHQEKGKHIITTQIEHHAILHTCQWLEAQGWQVTYLPVDADGFVTVQQVENALRPDTVLVSVMAANNEIGTLEPVAEIGALCHERGVFFHTDAVQAAGHLHINVKEQNIDMLSLSGHKFHGPKGVGVLYARQGIPLTNIIEGGAQERGKRAGTENIPGIMGLAAALEEGKVTKNSSFYCSGSTRVQGWNKAIYCSNHSGHGQQTLIEAVGHSCNPAFISMGLSVGTETYYKYLKSFGLMDKTGIDMIGEVKGIFQDEKSFNSQVVSLASYSFGQTFKTTPIQQITAVCAVANGGYMVTPHVVESLLDDQGNVVVSYADKTAKRQIISEEVGKELAEILAEGVISGVAKNAYVAGYNVAAKTGTSEKRDEEDKTLRVGSTVAFAPADDPKIAVLIIVDEPGSSVKSGGTVAAPYVAGVIDETLQYLGVGRNYTEEELALRSYDVPDFTSMTLDDARIQIQKAGLKYELIGEGDTIYGQLPAQGSRMQIEGGRIYLYVCPAGEEPAEPIQPSEVTVPYVTGYKVSAALTTLISGGFNVQITGSVNYEAGTGATVISQSIPQGRKVPIGTVIILESRHTDGVEDNN